MLSRVQYELFQKSIRFSINTPPGDADEFYDSSLEAQAAWDILHPYVVVVHSPTGNGYLLNRKYQLIFSVQNIPVPTQWVERELNHRASSFDTPDWAQWQAANGIDQFNSYWLY